MSTARPGAVLLVTSAAAFLSSLDLFIVNIAFPDIRADFPGTDLGQMSCRSYAVGAWASIGAVAAALGPPLGGLLVELSWHWVFLVNVPVGVVAFVAGLRVLRDPDVARTGMPDLVEALGIVVGVGALAFALVRSPDSGWGAPEVLAGFAVAVAGLVLVVLRSRRHPVPALDLAVLRVPVVALAALVMVAFTTGFAGMLVVNVLYLTGTWGWSAQAAGLGLAAGPLVVVFVSRLAGHLSGRFGIGPVAFVGTLAFAAGPTWWLTHVGVAPDYLVGMLPGQVLTGLGVGLILPTLSSVVGSALPASRWGSGSSLINTARQVGSVLGVALLVSVIGAHTTGLPSEFGSVRAGWGLLAGAALVAAVLAVGLSVVERRRVVTTPGEPAVVIDVGDGVTAEPGPPIEPRSDVAVDALADVRVGTGFRGAVVRGVVRDGRGLPVPGAITTVIDAAGAQLGRAQADPGGRFAMTLDPARTSPAEHVIVLVSAPGHHPRARRVPAAGGPALELALVRRDTVAA